MKDYKMILRNSSLVLCFTLIYISACQKSEKKADQAHQRPNIVLIIADDVGWDDLAVYGHPGITTPNLDKLAEDGMLFNQAFLTTSSCSPSRTSIISGLYPHNTDAEQLSWPLPEGKRTFVQELKDAGYWTGLAGKYHMGDPVRDDFDVLLEMLWLDAPIGLDRRLVGDGSGSDEWISLLDQRPRDKPFFAWLASFDAHRPFYEGISDDPYDPQEVRIPPYMPDTDSVRKDFALYYDEIMRLDDYVGKVVAELEAQGVSENTMIVFISDNGRAFPRDKTTLYDGGIKTPWIVKWPAKVKAGSINNQLISSVDLAPTFMSLAGLEPLKEFDGVDFSATLGEEMTSFREDIYAEDHFHDFEDYTRAVRTKQFKYIKNFYEDLPNTPSADVLRDLTWKSMKEEKAKGNLNADQMNCFVIPRPVEELYDVVADPYELNNLAMSQEYSNQMEDMRRRLQTIRTKTKDYLPTERTPDDFVRETGFPTKYRIRPRPSKAAYMKARKEGKVLMNLDWEE
ncbi:MAG: sulfatase [Cyclobacteriaceae bacterium]